MSIPALAKLGFSGSRCPVTHVISPNMTASFAGFHISHNASIAHYGSETTALVLRERVFFILNGNHSEELVKEARASGVAGCIRYFAEHIDQANRCSEHLMAVGLTSDPFELCPTAQEIIGEGGIALVAEAAKAAKAADLKARCQELLDQGDRVAAVKLYRSEALCSLVAAMKALGLK